MSTLPHHDHRRASTAQLCAVVTLALLGMWPARAQQPPNVTAGEMALLPEYCPDTMGFKFGDAHYNTSPRAPMWVAKMGKGFWAVHHHCWGLIKMRRALAPGLKKELREGGLRAAIGDFEYVINNTGPDFVILPEIYLKMGDAYVLLKNYGAAQEAYATSRAKKPDYWPAYVQWAEVLMKIGKKQDALSLLEEGLRLTPQERALRQPYERMGGNFDAFLRSMPPPPPPPPPQPPASSASG